MTQKFCKDCKYHFKQRDWDWMLTKDICLRYHVSNVVTGEPEYFTCTTRRVIGECSSDGQHFEPKEPIAQSIVNFFKRKPND